MLLVKVFIIWANKPKGNPFIQKVGAVYINAKQTLKLKRVEVYERAAGLLWDEIGPYLFVVSLENCKENLSDLIWGLSWVKT